MKTPKGRPYRDYDSLRNFLIPIKQVQVKIDVNGKKLATGVGGHVWRVGRIGSGRPDAGYSAARPGR